MPDNDNDKTQAQANMDAELDMLGGVSMNDKKEQVMELLAGNMEAGATLVMPIDRECRLFVMDNEGEIKPLVELPADRMVIFTITVCGITPADFRTQAEGTLPEVEQYHANAEKRKMAVQYMAPEIKA